MAPEVMNSGKMSDDDLSKRSFHGYGQSADWWSLGVIVYSMKFLRKPFMQPDGSSAKDAVHTEKDNLESHLYMERCKSNVV